MTNFNEKSNILFVKFKRNIALKQSCFTALICLLNSNNCKLW